MKKFCFVVLFVFCPALLFAEATQDGMPSFETISVTIGGGFLATGTFSASPVERLDQFLTRIVMMIQKTGVDPKSFPHRGILIKRANGEKINVDLAKFLITGDFKYNPALINEDFILIPCINLDINYIAIDGAVIYPQKLQFVDGDHLSDAIMLSQGIDPSYENVTKAIINRLSPDGNSETEDTVLVSDNPPLKRGDRIRILADEMSRKDYRVSVDGEVILPGSVFVTKSTTTIRQVIQKVGGIKPTADLEKAELIRGTNVFRSTIFSEEFENLLMARMARASEDDSAAFFIDNKLRMVRGNGVIDFAKIFDSNYSDGDFIVRSGDHIVIPEKVNLVYVFGQVNTPGYIKYEVGKGVDYYLEKAGGIGLTAKKEIYLVKGKTRSWHNIADHKEIAITPGDFIWVSKKPVRTFTFYLQQISYIATILVGTLTIVTVISNLSKL